MKFLFQYNFIIIHIGRIAMIFKVILDHLVAEIARAPYPISNGPRMTTPVLLGKLREFLLKTAGGPDLKAFHQVGNLLRRAVLDNYVHVVLANHALKDPIVLGIKYLFDNITAFDLDKEHFQGVLSKETEEGLDLAPFQIPKGRETGAERPNFRDKRPILLSFRDKAGQGRQGEPLGPNLLQQAESETGRKWELLAEGILVQDLKFGGFNIVDAHEEILERLEKLMLQVMIAIAWCQVGNLNDSKIRVIKSIKYRGREINECQYGQGYLSKVLLTGRNEVHINML